MCICECRVLQGMGRVRVQSIAESADLVSVARVVYDSQYQVVWAVIWDCWRLEWRTWGVADRNTSQPKLLPVFLVC